MTINHSTAHVPNDIVASGDWNAGHTGTLDHGTELTNVTSDQHHARQHSITSTSDHTSTATAGKILKADANGLPIDAINTDADVSDAVTKKHTQGTDTTLGNMTAAINMNTHQINGVVDPTLAQDAATKNYVDSQAGATKEFFIPPLFDGYSGSVSGLSYAVLGSTGATRFNFYLPDDFNSMTEAVIVVYPDATEQIQWDVMASRAAVGESVDTTSAEDQLKNVTVNQLNELDISGVLTGLAVGDYVGVKFESDTSDIRVVGLRFKYS